MNGGTVPPTRDRSKESGFRPTDDNRVDDFGVALLCEESGNVFTMLKHHSGMGLWIRIYGYAFFFGFPEKCAD